MIPISGRRAIIAWLAIASFGFAAEVRLREGAIEASGLGSDEIAKAALIVRVESPDNLPPLAGKTNVQDNIIRFSPAFPLRAGMTYRAELTIPGSTPVVTKLSLPRKKPPPAPHVTAVHPKADVLPENLLKFYLHFSAPIRAGGNYQHIRLLDSDGREVDLPFLELDEELWDSDHRRLTVFLDPARIKRGLVPHEKEGRAIRSGQSYTLVIKRGFEGMGETPLKREFRKSFKVSKPDYDQPSIKGWKLSAPPAGTRSPLLIDFGAPLDHGLLHRVVSIEGVMGEIRTSNNDSRWEFHPALPWKAGSHRVLVGTILEDLAGNSLRRPFEVLPGLPFIEDLRETESIEFEIVEKEASGSGTT